MSSSDLQRQEATNLSSIFVFNRFEHRKFDISFNIAYISKNNSLPSPSLTAILQLHSPVSDNDSLEFPAANYDDTVVQLYSLQLG